MNPTSIQHEIAEQNRIKVEIATTIMVRSFLCALVTAKHINIPIKPKPRRIKIIANVNKQLITKIPP